MELEIEVKLMLCYVQNLLEPKVQSYKQNEVKIIWFLLYLETVLDL